MLRVGIVAGEPSGDLLGADLMRAIRARRQDVHFEGVAGPRMIAQGCKTLCPMDRLTVVGLLEALRHVPGLLALRRRLRTHFTSNPPDVFVGIDAPDFNLTLERQLRAVGIPVAHYVSPTVWAWRSYRTRKIGRSANLVLTLFPFESAFLADRGVAARFTGHPLFDNVPLHVDASGARRTLGLAAGEELVALLPGSRASEARQLAETFLQAALRLREQRPGVRFIVPLVSAPVAEIVTQALRRVGSEEVFELFEGRSHEVLAAADVVLTASGTATLEAMLFKRPMVVAYRLSALGHALVKTMLRIPHVSLPNLLAERELVPEFLQDRVTPENLAGALLRWLEDSAATATLVAEFTALHRRLSGRAAGECAAEAVLSLVQRRAV